MTGETRIHQTNLPLLRRRTFPGVKSGGVVYELILLG